MIEVIKTERRKALTLTGQNEGMRTEILERKCQGMRFKERIEASQKERGQCGSIPDRGSKWTTGHPRLGVS